MKKLLSVTILGLCFLTTTVQCTNAQQNGENPAADNVTSEEQEIIDLSADKWRWMAEQDVETLTTLFHEDAVFVHMGGSWGTERELNIIGSGGIWYKETDIHEVSVNIIDDTAILLNRITLVAEVGGNEVTNPFEVTEVYVRQDDGSWKLGSLSFTRLMAGPPEE